MKEITSRLTFSVSDKPDTTSYKIHHVFKDKIPEALKKTYKHEIESKVFSAEDGSRLVDHQSKTILLGLGEEKKCNIRKIAADAEVTTLAGSGSNGYSDGTGTGASFNTPAGLVINPQGLFFVGDQGNTRVRQMTSIGEVSTLAGNSTPAYTDGTGTGASFMSPYGLAVDNVGEIIVADLNKIRRVNLDGVVTTFTGKETAGWIDGTLETAEFNGLRGVARWKNDFIIAADAGNHVIRMITPAGTVITIAGDGTSGYVNGNGHEAKFNFPNGISVNSRNEIFVADRLNHVIRKIVLK